MINFYIIPLAICVICGILVPGLLNKDDLDERMIYSIISLIPLVNIVTSVVCLVYLLSFIFKITNKQ